VANRVGVIEQAQRRARRLVVSLADDIHEARLASGVRQADVARAVGWSISKVARMERGDPPNPSLEELAVLAACVGLHVSAQTYPAGSLLRDQRQVRLINEFVARVRPGRWELRTEAPVGDPRDHRAVDLVLRRDAVIIAVEAVSRLRDAQAQLRPLMLKAQAIRATRLVLLVAATAGNRRAIAEAGEALRASLPLGTQRTLGSLRSGRDPGANGIVLL
jgi:transcriptional regulator with XRE-family HTH domain